MAYTKFAYYYDRLMDDMPYPEWLRFLDECWERYGKPKTVVDLGCGTGSIAIPLSRQGFRVTGIDLSEDMLAVARSKSDYAASGFRAANSVTWLQQDMTEWELPEQVDCAISLCDCLNYLTEQEDIESAFRLTAAGLKSGGLFVFDVHTPRLLAEYAHTQPFILNEDDIAYIWTCELHEERCEIEHQLTIFVREPNADGGKDSFMRVEERHVQRGYPLDWLRGRLLASGFGSVEIFADFAWRAPSEESGRAFFIARKT